VCADVEQQSRWWGRFCRLKPKPDTFSLDRARRRQYLQPPPPVFRGHCLKRLKPEGQPSECIRVLISSRDGKWLLSGGDGRAVHLWDTETWQCVRSCKSPKKVRLPLCIASMSGTLSHASCEVAVGCWPATMGSGSLAAETAELFPFGTPRLGSVRAVARRRKRNDSPLCSVRTVAWIR
jgi:WD40 repeat protein